MKINKIAFWIMAVVMLMGCAANPTSAVPQATPPSPTQTVVPGPTSSLKASQVSPTASVLPGPTSSSSASQVSPTAPVLPRATVGVSPTPPVNKFTIQPVCPAEKVGIQELSTLPGTLVFSAWDKLTGNDILSPAPGKSFTFSFWQPQLAKISTYTPKEDQRFYYIASPNKEKLAFTQIRSYFEKKGELIVLDRQGKELGSVPVLDDWKFFGWLNNEQILLQRFGDDKFELTAINLATKEQKSLPTNFPDIFLNQRLEDWGSQVLFNTQETLVLYPISLGSGRIQPVLWNVKESKEVARINRGSWARWSPDGNRLMWIGGEDGTHDVIFVNDASGFRATFSADDYKLARIEQPVWSPDNRHIAFWLITKNTDFASTTAQLGVLDTETLTVKLFCKEIKPYGPLSETAAMLGYQAEWIIPIWSPDSNYLLIKDQGTELSTYLYDLRNNAITKIANKAGPIEWLK